MGLINCNSCGTDTCHDKGFWYTRGKYDDNFLIMFFKTPFVYNNGSVIERCEKNHYLIFSPNSNAFHSDDGSTDTGFINDWIFADGQLCREIIQKAGLPLNKAFYLQRFDILEKYIGRVNKEQVEKGTCYEYRISSLISDALVDMGRQWVLTAKNNHPAFEEINNVRNYMLRNCHKKINLAQLSDMTGYSESRFCVLYNSFFGTTPIDDLLNARIEKAKSMLSYSSMSVTEIAEKCGFSSVHYFSRKFKEFTGDSPTKYKL